MLCQMHFSHAAGAEQALELVLTQLPGFERFAPQEVDRANPPGANDGGQCHRHEERHQVRRRYHVRHVRHIDSRQCKNHDRCDCEHAENDRCAFPGVRNVERVNQNQQHPWRRRADNERFIGHQIQPLHEHEEHRRHTENHEFRRPQRGQRVRAFMTQPAAHAEQRDRYQAVENQHEQFPAAGVIGRKQLAQKKGAEAGSQQQRGNPQAATQQRLRFLRHVRAAAALAHRHFAAAAVGLGRCPQAVQQGAGNRGLVR